MILNNLYVRRWKLIWASSLVLKVVSRIYVQDTKAWCVLSKTEALLWTFSYYENKLTNKENNYDVKIIAHPMETCVLQILNVRGSVVVQYDGRSTYIFKYDTLLLIFKHVADLNFYASVLMNITRNLSFELLAGEIISI